MLTTTSLASIGSPWCSCVNLTESAPATLSVAAGRRSASVGVQPKAAACWSRKRRARSSGAKGAAVRRGTPRSNQSRTRPASSTATRPPGVSDGRGRSRPWAFCIAARGYLRLGVLRRFGAFFEAFFFPAGCFEGPGGAKLMGNALLFSPGRMLIP